MEISDESIEATTIDPLQTQSKSESRSEAPLDMAALRLFRVASRVGVAPLAAAVANSIIHGDNHNKQEYESRASRNIGCTPTRTPNLLKAIARSIMTTPYSICHPRPMAALALPRARALQPQGSLAPSVPPPSPLHCTSTPSSQCPVGLYLPALFHMR